MPNYRKCSSFTFKKYTTGWRIFPASFNSHGIPKASIIREQQLYELLHRFANPGGGASALEVQYILYFQGAMEAPLDVGV
jgi:hypothetical protein